MTNQRPPAVDPSFRVETPFRFLLTINLPPPPPSPCHPGSGLDPALISSPKRQFTTFAAFRCVFVLNWFKRIPGFVISVAPFSHHTTPHRFAHVATDSAPPPLRQTGCGLHSRWFTEAVLRQRLGIGAPTDAFASIRVSPVASGPLVGGSRFFFFVCLFVLLLVGFPCLFASLCGSHTVCLPPFRTRGCAGPSDTCLSPPPPFLLPLTSQTDEINRFRHVRHPGSIAQIYRGRLRNGCEVAIKVRHPGVKVRVATDVALLRAALPALRLLPGAYWMNIEKGFDQVRLLAPLTGVRKPGWEGGGVHHQGRWVASWPLRGSG